MQAMEPALQQLADTIHHAAAHGTPLRIRGGGTKDFYGQTLQGAVLDTRAWRGITAYEPSELVVTARSGTPLAELEATLAAQGQCLAFEPPRFGGAGGGGTVGGMVAAGLSGPARANAGAVRDYMLGVSILNGRAEHLSFGGQVMKNVAGYDVSRLMAGALGTLGLITEVSLKVLPVAPAEATLRFAWGQAEALQQLHRWGGQPLPLNASCWVDDNGEPTLYVRLRGAVAAVEAAIRQMGQMGGEVQDQATVAADWQACRDQQLPWFQARAGRDLWRLSVPQTAPVLDLPNTPLVEWHGAQRWVMLDAGDTAAASHLRRIATAAGGSATLFIASGADAACARGQFDALSAPLEQIHRGLKHEFDPAGILNRGRLCADL